MFHSHRIRALSWQVRTGSPQEAFALRKRLRDELHPALLPAIDRVFEETAPEGVVLRIPRLAVHLRIAAGDRLAEVLAEALRRRLLELLGEAAVATPAISATSAISAISAMPTLSATSATSEASEASGTSAMPALLARSGVSATAASSMPGVSETKGPDTLGAITLEAPLSFTFSTTDAERLQVLICYLETGDLPWSVAGSDRAAVLDELRLAVERELAAILATPVSRDPVAFYFRLLQLTPYEEWVAVAQVVAERAVGQLGEALEEAVAALAGATSTSRHSRLQLAAAALTALGAGAESPAAKEVVAVLGEVVSPAGESPVVAVLPEAVSTFFRLWLEERDSKDSRDFKDIKKATRKASAAAAKKPQPASSSQPLMSLQSLLSLGSFQSLQSLLPMAPAPPLPARAAATTGTPSTGPAPGGAPKEPALIARLGGLILLHPFLPRFFESTGVLEEDQLQRPRAAALLHLLATGEEEPYELDLGFIKILLGLRPGEPLPVAGGLLRDTDREEAEALLQAVIGHWSVLKNTSPEGLRHTFLQRRGLLREKEEGFHLQLEPESFDVLLGHLPWGIGTVKLPWMKKPIFTDWPTH